MYSISFEYDTAFNRKLLISDTGTDCKAKVDSEEKHASSTALSLFRLDASEKILSHFPHLSREIKVLERSELGRG